MNNCSDTPASHSQSCSEDYGKPIGFFLMPIDSEIMCQSIRKRKEIIELKKQGLSEESAAKFTEMVSRYDGKYNSSLTKVKDTGYHEDGERPMHFYNSDGVYHESLD